MTHQFTVPKVTEIAPQPAGPKRPPATPGR
jgi:hypothetical protein